MIFFKNLFFKVVCDISLHFHRGAGLHITKTESESGAQRVNLLQKRVLLLHHTTKDGVSRPASMINLRRTQSSASHIFTRFRSFTVKESNCSYLASIITDVGERHSVTCFDFTQEGLQLQL